MSPLNNLVNPIEREILDLVINQFLTERKATSRRKLVQMFEDPELLDQMVKRSMLFEQDRQLYLPTVLAFEFCQLPDVTQSARNAVGIVLKCLQSLYKTESQKADFTPAEVKERASKLFELTDDETIWLGLYLIREFNVLDSYAWNLEGIQVSSIRPSEQIILVKDIGSQWKKLIDQRTAYWLPEGEFSGELPSSHEEIDAPSRTNQGWRTTTSHMLIFISHSSQDKDVALGLIELLRAAFALTDEQIRCTSVDGFRLPSGANTDEVLKIEVREAKAFIGLITRNSLSSAYVLFELGARWGAGLHMIPVLAGIGPEALQGPLKGMNSISANSIAQLHQLLSDLADALGLDLLRAASYTRYAEKLIAQLQGTYRISSATPSVARPAAPGNLGQEGGERRLRALTSDDVIMASKTLNWTKQLPKWTVRIEGTSFPVRPLAFKAAGLFPNDSATTHQAVAVLKQLGFQVFYENKPA